MFVVHHSLSCLGGSGHTHILYYVPRSSNHRQLRILPCILLLACVTSLPDHRALLLSKKKPIAPWGLRLIAFCLSFCDPGLSNIYTYPPLHSPKSKSSNQYPSLMHRVRNGRWRKNLQLTASRPLWSIGQRRGLCFFDQNFHLLLFQQANCIDMRWFSPLAIGARLSLLKPLSQLVSIKDALATRQVTNPRWCFAWT